MGQRYQALRAGWVLGAVPDVTVDTGVAGLLGPDHTTSQMTYDRRRLRLHGCIERLPHTNTVAGDETLVASWRAPKRCESRLSGTSASVAWIIALRLPVFAGAQDR